MSNMRKELTEIVELVKLVPEQFQQRCFEMLLTELIESNRQAAEPVLPRKTSKPEAAPTTDTADPLIAEKHLEEKVTNQSDIGNADLHVKAKHFLKKYSISLEKLNNLFYKEDSKFLPLYEDLGTTRMAETQIRIAMLQAFSNGLSTGDFCTTVEAVREECKVRKTYDQANFTSIFKNNATVFDFGTWAKDVTELQLSDEGKKQLADVVSKID